MRVSAFVLLIAAAATPAVAQDAAPRARYVSLIGTIEKVDASGKVLEIKPDKPGQTSVRFDDRTQFLRLPTGETDAKKATRATAADVSAGDRVIARLRAGQETEPAVFLYFTKQNDLTQRKEKTLEEWQKDGVSGLVSNVDAAGKKIVISVRGGGPPRDVTLDVSGNVDYQRFSADSGKYEPGTLASIQPGNQVRVLGDKNVDQTAIKAEAIMSGLFRTLPVQIKSIDAGTGQIQATDLATKKAILINIKADTTMKKLDDATALQMARRLNPTLQGGRGGRNGDAADAPARGQGRGSGRIIDLGRILDQQPSITVADLKAGEPVVVVGAATEDMSSMRALKLVTGVDPILRAAPQNGPDPLGGNWNLGGDLGGAPE